MGTEIRNSSVSRDFDFHNTSNQISQRIPVVDLFGTASPGNVPFPVQRKGSLVYDFVTNSVYYSGPNPTGPPFPLVWIPFFTTPVPGTEPLSATLVVGNATGGTDIDVTSGDSIRSSGQLPLISSQAATDAIRINASNAAGGIDADAGTGGISINTSGALVLTSTNITPLIVQNSNGGVNLISGGATSGAVIILTTNLAGGVTIGAGTGGATVATTGQIALRSSQSAANAVCIDASNAGGGIDVDAGTGGIDVDTSGSIRVNSNLAASTNAMVLGVVANSGMEFEVGGSANLAISGTDVNIVGGNSLTVGTSGTATPLTQIRVFSTTINPASVPANSVNALTFGITGLATADAVYVNPGTNLGVGLGTIRVSAADTLSVEFVNPTGSAVDPPSSTWKIVTIRS